MMNATSVINNNTFNNKIRCRRVRAISENLLDGGDLRNGSHSHRCQLDGDYDEGWYKSSDNIYSSNSLRVMVTCAADEPCCSLNVSPSNSPTRHRSRNFSNQSAGESSGTSTTTTGMPPMTLPSMKTFVVNNLGGNAAQVSSNMIDQKNMVFKDIEAFVSHFCEDRGKARHVKKILVATNGIAAVKCILSMRKLLMQLFRNDRIIKFVCLTTEQEVQSKAEYLKMADYLVFSPAGANTNNYANVDEIVEHATRHNVDAVWAGWGHASENPRLPEELARHNIVFIGPPGKAMFALGDKIASTIIAQTVQIPTIEWSGSGLTVPQEEGDKADLEISKELYLKACVSTVKEGLQSMKEKNIAYPVMIKASEGGGGKGIRKCMSDEEFRLNFRRVQAEVPGSPIFIMKCMINARHIEVQLIGDHYGQVIPIFTRDCSIQRRCQKIIEEAPAGIVPPHIQRQMQMDAVNLAKKVGYVSAGTVEYMYLAAEQKYYFLELNPRLQVEHPCTEMVANINIPAIQLQIAMGIPLHRITEIRLFYGMDRYGTSPLPEEQCRTDTNISVIAARITSEDPAEGFRPASGAVEVLNFQSNQNVWGYFSVSSTGKVHEFADSQFGHLFAKGTTRYEAISALLCALKELELRATFTSQVNYLVGLLHDKEFENNEFHTGWLDARIASKVHSAPELPVHVTVAIGATLVGYARILEVFSKFQAALERGQILPKSGLTETWELELVHNNIKYSVMVNRFGNINYLVRLNDSHICTVVRELGNGTMIVTYSDQAYTCHLEEETERYKVIIGKTLTIFDKENDPSMLRSKNAGRFLQYLKKDGEHVATGEVYAEMESMKMVINLEVPKAGGRIVQVAQPGQVLFPGTLIARLEDQDDVSVPKPKNFTGRMEEWDATREKELQDRMKSRLDTHFEDVMQACKNILSGYSMPEPYFREQISYLVDDLLNVLNSPRLPFALFKVMLHAVESRICRIASYEKIKRLIGDDTKPFPAIELAEEMENYLSSLDPTELGIEKQYFESLLKICERFEGGLQGHLKIVVNEFLELFLDTEHHFQDVSYDKGVSSIKSGISDASIVVRMIYSHTKVQAKNAFLQTLLSRMDQKLVPQLQMVFKRIANLFNPEIEPLAIYIRQTLNKIHQKPYSQICSNIRQRQNNSTTQHSLNELVTNYSAAGGDSLLRQFVGGDNGNSAEHLVLLHEFFFTRNADTNQCAVRLFISKLFQVQEEDIQQLPSTDQSAMFFRFELKPSSPFFNCKKQQKAASSVSNGLAQSKPFVYYLTVVRELDATNHAHVFEKLKKEARATADNTFLFIAHPKEAGGSSTDMRQLGNKLREEIGHKLGKSGDVELMFSTPSHPPFYTTSLDFSTKEKLELYRLPAGAENLTQPDSPYLIFRTKEHGLSRIFVRSLQRNVSSVLALPDRFSTVNKFELLRNKIVDLLDGACGEIRVCSSTDKDKLQTYDCNHVFIRLDYDSKVTTEGWSSAIEGAIKQCEKYLIKHRVTEVEVTFEQLSHLEPGSSNGTRQQFETVRVVYMNETGAIPEICIYRIVDGKLLPEGSGGHARLAGKSSATPHHTIQQVNVQKKRYQANKLGTTYVYDIPLMFGKAVLDEWTDFKGTDPRSYNDSFELLPQEQQHAIRNGDVRKLAKACEIVLAEDHGQIAIIRDEAELNRRMSSGCNDRGMIAWEMQLWTPDCPHGRYTVLISNDITFQMGSFSMREHRLYQKASEYSRRNRMPRVYVAANSGARIGFAADVKSHLSIVWNDEERPEDGFKHLALDTEEAHIVEQVESTVVGGRRRIEAVIGRENDIGVENLVGSGLIASETSAAYMEVPTYCLVTGRAVGIGAYVARLSHRICQVDSSHIILTGAAAINSLLGREVYTSNNQLGGPQIMYLNGVSHSVAQNDLDGVKRILRWITYLPPTVPARQLMGMTVAAPSMFKDDKARLVHTQPTKSVHDPRLILDPPEGGGLFDRGTFDEIMSGWAKTIITGRARLRGLPVGVVAVETRTVECEIPADPATQDSQSKCVLQAGQVWYPDSAFKTAEAISDFNKEGLPLIIVANIRGFSGGQKDMFEMVLKFGAWIVDALQAYTQPVVVYLPPFGELRGGAWAVLDTQINPTCITMLADPDSRGGVLESSGIVEIKFRERDLVQLLKKCDQKTSELEREISRASDPVYKGEVQQELERRKEKLLPICRAAAVKFADLHDTTARMLAKGAIHDEVAWQNARNYFFDLICVNTLKMQMARLYLDASGHHCAFKASIEDLTAGCAWVDKHLEEAKVPVRREVTPKERPSMEHSKRNRYVYTAEHLREYANGHGFREVLAQIRRSRLLEQLQSLSKEHKAQLIAALGQQN